MSKRDYYEILGVSRTCNEVELKAAFRKLAMQHHPDRNPGDADCEHKFKELNEAYDVLKDGDKRAAYDRFGHAAFEQGGMGGGAHGFGADFASTFSDIFEDLFGMGGGRRGGRGQGRERGSDLRYNMEISAGRGLRRQDRADPHSDVGHLRSLLRLGRQDRQQAEALRDLRRRRQDQACARFLHAGAHLSGLSRPRRGDRKSLSVLRRLRTDHARAHAVGQYPGRRRGRHPHPPCR